MKIKEIKHADISLVELRDDGDIGELTPHCKLHCAMNKLTESGIWRCVSTYKVIDQKSENIKENACKAGCQEDLE